jgi:hypothetical protein
MKKTNFKLPGLPSISTTPKSITKAPPLRDSNISRVGGLNNGISKPINLGKASRAATTAPQSTSPWSSLLSGATSSSGLASTLSGATGFGGVIGSLVSGLTSLFGGAKTAPPALVAYQLPTAQEQTVSTGSSVSTPGVYGGPSASSPFESQTGQIVQSVKQALLNSSSLNDVIAEL